MSRFPEDHYVEVLRGLKRPSVSTVKKALAARCAWLARKIEIETRTEVREAKKSFYADELAAIVIAVEAIENGTPE